MPFRRDDSNATNPSGAAAETSSSSKDASHDADNDSEKGPENVRRRRAGDTLRYLSAGTSNSPETDPDMGSQDVPRRDVGDTRRSRVLAAVDVVDPSDRVGDDLSTFSDETPGDFAERDFLILLNPEDFSAADVSSTLRVPVFELRVPFVRSKLLGEDHCRRLRLLRALGDADLEAACDALAQQSLPLGRISPPPCDPEYGI